MVYKSIDYLFLWKFFSNEGNYLNLLNFFGWLILLVLVKRLLFRLVEIYLFALFGELILELNENF